MTRPVPLENLLSQLLNETHQNELGWQFAVLVVCGLASWGVMRWIWPRLAQVHGTWRLGLEGLKRIGLPLVTLVLVLIGREILETWQPVHVLNIAVPLLGAMSIGAHPGVYAALRIAQQ